MKKLILSAAILALAAIGTSVKAQVSINVNIGARPYYVPVRYDYVAYVPVRYKTNYSIYKRKAPVPYYHSNYKVKKAHYRSAGYYNNNVYYSRNTKHFTKKYKPVPFKAKHYNDRGHHKGLR